MKPAVTLDQFVDDELLRAPMAFDQVVDAVLQQWQRSAPASARMAVDAVRIVTHGRIDLVNTAMRELRRQVSAEITATQAAPVGAAISSGAPARQVLSLIDDDEVSADIELSRAVERIKSAAEFELRELQTFTSALVDDVNVARDTNPFRPETYATAFWKATCSVLPLSRNLQAGFMRDAAEPLAKVLRQSYAAACTRLEDQGVEPAAYRTIVLSVATRGGSALPTRPGDHLADLRDSMPLPLPASTDPAAPAAAVMALPNPAAVAVTVAAVAAVAAAKTAAVDPQVIELLTRLFDALQSDPQMSPQNSSLLLRLQPSALRVALRDASMLENYAHPVWRFMDGLVFLNEVVSATEAAPCRSHSHQLVDHLVADGTADATRFEWALGRLAAFDRHLLEAALLAAQPNIARLQSTIDTANMPIDVGTLDTVPAELMPDLPAVKAAQTPALDLLPGLRLRVCLRGEWRLLQVLWRDHGAEHWLLRDMANDECWALHQRALDRLAAEQLAQPCHARSLVRDAAERVLMSIDVKH